MDNESPEMENAAVRDYGGYEVPEKLRKIWAVERDLLKVFLEVCRKHEIHVQVFAGTLLGAVRHRGFIPWDDDVDVCMDRENFNKLLNLPAGTFPSPYFLQTFYNDQKFYNPFARLRNSDTTGMVRWQASPDYNNGIYIDLHVMDGMADGFLLRLQERYLHLALRLAEVKLEGGGKRRMTFVGRCGKFISRFLSVNFCIKLHQFLLRLFSSSSNRLSMLTHPKYFVEKYWLYKSELADSIELEFDGLSVPAPRAYDKVLARIYGDYMNPPPAAKRGKWHEGVIFFDPDRPYTVVFKEGLYPEEFKA